LSGQSADALASNRARSLEFGEELPQIRKEKLQNQMLGQGIQAPQLGSGSGLGIELGGSGHTRGGSEDCERERERGLPVPGSVLAAAAKIEESLPKSPI
jgi:hypothetical protein